MYLVVFLEVLCFVCFIHNTLSFLNLFYFQPQKSFAYILWFLIFMGFLCVQMCVFIHLYIFLVLFFGSFFVFVFFACLFCLILVCFCFYLTLFNYLDVCLFSNEGEKQRVYIWEGGEVEKIWEELRKGKSITRINCIKIHFQQDI